MSARHLSQPGTEEALSNPSYNDYGFLFPPASRCVVPGADVMCLAPMQQDFRGCRLSLLFLLLQLWPWPLPRAPHEEVARLSTPICNRACSSWIFVRKAFLRWFSCLHERLRGWKASGWEPRAGVVIP